MTPLFRIRFGRPSAKEQKRIDAEEEARKQKKHEDEIRGMYKGQLYHPANPWRGGRSYK